MLLYGVTPACLKQASSPQFIEIYRTNFRILSENENVVVLLGGHVDKRLEFKYKLHERYAVQGYDNADVWAGTLTVELDGIRYDAVMARAFLMSDSAVEARVRAELFVSRLVPIRFGVVFQLPKSVCEKLVRVWMQMGNL